MNLFSEDKIGAFIHQIDLALTNYASNRFSALNIAPEQSLILFALWEEGILTQKEISQKLYKDKAIITRMVDSLVKKNFVQREISQGDRRLQSISLTAEGKKLMESLVPISAEINQQVCQGISSAELQEVIRILSKMNQNVQEN